ncbi:MAG: phage tail sheath C-terminal domain-containing protein [Bacteroidota bacterium]
MAVQPTYPGVYIEEVPSGVRTIVGVSTSIAAFIGYFKRGPMNRAVRISNFGDFERAFGGLDIDSEASYAIMQFFLNGGTQAYVVRVASGAPARASIADPPLGVEAIEAGTWGNNVRFAIDHSTPVANEFNMTIAEYDAVSGKLLRQEVFRNLGIDPNSTQRNFVWDIINDANTGSTIVQISGARPAAAITLPTANGTTSDPIVAPLALPANPTIDISLNGGAAITINLLDLVAGNNSLNAIAGSLENAIRAANPANPIYANTAVNVVDDRLQVVPGGTTAASVFTFSNGVVTDLQFDGVTPQPLEYALGSATPGTNGTVPDATALIGSLNNKTGLFALEDVDLFNILCIPRTGIRTGTNALTDAQADSVLSAAIAYCNSKRAFLIMDTPLGIDSLSEIKNWMDSSGNNLRDKNAAIYYPRVSVPDPLDNFRLRSVGACGTVAGLYARTDGTRGVWKAPAGTEAALRNVSELTNVLSDRENGVLNPLGVNCLVNKPVYGNICWGARTLVGADQMASEWKYVPIRRLTLFLEESLFRGLHWVVFEPNDESLWGQIRLNVGAFMNNLFKQGAFQGSSPKEAYLVKCDRETTTQNDINLGIVNIVLGFAPLRPAEFVIIKIQQLAGQVQA